MASFSVGSQRPCRRFEWLSYAVMLSPHPLLAVKPGVFATLPVPAAVKAFLPDRLLTPPWAFLLAEVTSMLPRAIRGVQWYRRKFGREWDESGRRGGRWVVIPGIM
jgi:3-oxo-5-alpha-steroid 4-dehydrogenase 1